MKKLWMILLALVLVFGLVISCEEETKETPKVKYCEYCGLAIGAEHKAAEWKDEKICWCILCLNDYSECECEFIGRKLNLIQNGAGGLPAIDEGRLGRGEGYFGGKEFGWVKTAKPGSKLRLDMKNTGTGSEGNLDWASIAGITVGMQGGGQVEVAPGTGEYTATLNIEDYWRANRFDEATYGQATSWDAGGFQTIVQLLLLIKKADIGPQDVAAKDFYIDASLVHYLDVAAVPDAPVKIRPRHNMSKGAITIKYAGSTTVPKTVGVYAVTFDVAAAAGYNAATDLVVGNLEVNASKPFFLDSVVEGTGPLGVTLSGNADAVFSGYNAAQVKKSTAILIETKQPAGLEGTNLTGFPKFTITINGVSWQQVDSINGAAGTTIARAEGDTIYIVINIATTHNLDTGINDWCSLQLSSWDQPASTFGIVRGYLIDSTLAKPAGAIDFATPANGYMYKLP